MKRLIIALFALLTLAVACDKENGKNLTSRDGITTIQAVISDDVDTRALLDGTTYKQVWEAGDEISLFDGVSHIKFTLTDGAGTPTASFSTEASVAVADHYYAVYPYSETNALDQDSISVVYPYDITLDPATGHTNGVNIMMAKSEGSAFEFKNACSFVKLDLTGNELIESISVVCKEIESLAGTGKYAITDAGLKGRFTRSATCLKVDCGAGLQLPATVCIPVPPTVTDGFTLYITNKAGLSTRASATTSESVGYNKVVEMPALNVVCDKAYLEGMNFNKTVKSFIKGQFVTSTSDYDSTITKIVFLANQDMTDVSGIPVGAGNDKCAIASLDGSTLTVKTAAPGYVVNLRYLFSYFSGLEQIEGLNLFDTSISNSMYYTFGHCHNLQSVDLSTFNTENVTTMQYAFNACWKLQAINCSTFNTAKVTTMNQMFRQCFVADPIDVSSFTSESLENTYYMFMSCEKVQELNFNEQFTLDNATITSYMFHHCSSVQELDLRHFSLAKDTTVRHMFDSCVALTSLKQNFDTRNVENFHSMFRRCMSLEEVDLSNMNTAKGVNFAYMFRLCPKLRTINLSGASSASATGTSQYMFNTSNTSDAPTTALREIILGPDFGWPGTTTTNTNNFWPAPSTLTATAEDPLVVKCSLIFAQAAVKRNLQNLITPLKDGRIVLKNLSGNEFLYNNYETVDDVQVLVPINKTDITSSAVLTDPDA